MIHVEIIQDLLMPEREWVCEVRAHHRQDGEYPAHTESFEVKGEWPVAIDWARAKFGDEISSLDMRYEEER